MKGLGRATTCVAALAISSIAHAQQVAPADPEAASAAAPADDQAQAGLEEIVVTAQRRAQNLQDVPIAITAVSAGRLEAANIVSAADIGQLTPSLTLTQVAGTLQPHLRGVGTSSTGPGVENPVAMYIDGVYIASGTSSLLTLNNIERIEVLKGPQGTLFGRNATGGLIHVITKDPQQAPSAAFNIGYGNYDTFVGDAYVTGGFSEQVAADFAIRYERQGEGWGRNLFNGRDTGRLNHDITARSKVLIEAGDATTIRLTGDYTNREGSLDSQHWYPGYPITFNNPFFGGPFDQGGPYDINKNVDERTRLRSGGASLQINHEFDTVNVQSITAFRKAKFNFSLDLDLTPVDLISCCGTARSRQFSQELQLSDNSTSRFNWVTGVYFFAAKDQYDPLDIAFNGPVSPVPGVPFTIRANNAVKTESIAGYGQASYEIFDGTTLTLGGRFTYENKRLSGTQTILVGGAATMTLPLPIPGSGIPAKIDYQRFNYRVSLDHKFAPNILGYISYNTGFKSGGYNLASAANPPYRPEDIKAAEVGLKTQLFDRRLRFNIAGFYYDYANIQVANFTGGTLITRNGAESEIYGFDLDADLTLGGGLSLSGGVGYVHDRFTSYPDAPFYAGFGGCAVPPGRFCSQSAEGNKLAQTPTWSYNIGANYKKDIAAGALEFNLLYSYSSRWYASADNFAFQPAYGLLNASVQWSDPSDRWSVRVWGRNLTDEIFATGVIEANHGVLRQLGVPRTYGVTLGAKF